jgi:hypothetical protein
MTTINTSDLKQAVKLLISGIGSDQALEGADSFLFSGGALHAFNGSVSVSVPLKDSHDKPTELHGCVKAKTFSAWVNKLKNDSVTFTTLPDGSWEIVSGKSQINPTPFTDPLSVHLEALNLAALEWKDLPEAFHGLMSLVRLDNQKSNVPFVLFNGQTALATDGARFNSVAFDEDMGNHAIHTEDLKAVLQTPDLRQVSVSDAWVHFLTESGIVWTTRKMDGSAYRADVHQKILGMTEDAIASGDQRNVSTDLPEGLGDSVDKLGVYATSDKVSGTVRVDLEIKTAGLTMNAARTEGKARESLDWPEPLPEGVNIDLAVSGPFLKEAGAMGLRLHVLYIDGKAKDGTPKTMTQMAFKGANFTQVVKMIAKA